MNEQKKIPAGRGRDLFLNRYLTCFTRDAEEILHSVLGGAYKNMACMEQQNCQVYMQYVADAAEQLAEMLIEIREGLCKGTNNTEYMEIINFKELFNAIIAQLKFIYADEEMYISTETDIKHRILSRDKDELIRSFIKAVIGFMAYKGTNGTYRLRLKETPVCRNKSEFCFEIEKTANRNEAFLQVDREKERVLYLEMENICHWLQDYEGNLQLRENGYKMTFLCCIEEQECLFEESRVYAMRDVRRDKMDRGIELACIRKRYRQLAGKRILLAVCRKEDTVLKELFELTGIRTEIITDRDEILRRIWWSERERFDGIVVCTQGCFERGVSLAEKISETEWNDGRKIPVIVIGGDREDMDGRMVIIPDSSSFERILDLLHCSYEGRE